jgi:hypothetical protein
MSDTTEATILVRIERLDRHPEGDMPPLGGVFETDERRTSRNS